MVENVVSILNVSAQEKKHFGKAREPFEPIMEKWYNSLRARNEHTAYVYVKYASLSVKRLKTSGEELVSKLKSGEWNVYDKIQELVSIISGACLLATLSKKGGLPHVVGMS
jgi:hypothetical protein